MNERTWKIITNNLLLHKTCCAFMMHKSCFAWFPLPDGLHTCIQKWYRNETEMIRWKKMIHKMNYMHPPTFGVFWLLIFSSCKTKHSIVHKKSYKFCWWSLIWCNKPLTIFFQFLRYQENAIFQFCLYSPLNEKYTLHLAQRCTYIERSKYLYHM